MRTHFIFVCGALLGALAAGCPGEGDDDDDTTSGVEPDQCENFGLDNILYSFEFTEPENAYGYDGTDDEYWTGVAQDYANDGDPANDAFSLFGSGLELTVGAHDPAGSMQKLTLNYGEGEDLLLWLDFEYHLPQGRTIPVEVGDTVLWDYHWNFTNLDHPSTAVQVKTADGVVLFYGEPGANGVALDNDDRFYIPAWDYNPTANPFFENVVPNDVGCSPTLELDCGNQYNLQVQYYTWDQQSLALWPGESSTFEVTYSDEIVEQYDLINVWSYDWADVSCEGPQYERNYAFFVLPAS